MTIAIIIVACLYLGFNIVTSAMYSPEDMKKKFIDGQCNVGRIAAAIFYSPAWALKGIKFLFNKGIK